MQDKFIGFLPSDTLTENIPFEVTIEPLWGHKKGLMYTSTGYGSKIPTEYKMKVNNRLYRVYCRIYSNIGSLYILQNKKRVFVYIQKVQL